MRWTRLVATLFVVVLVVLAGCAGDGGDGDGEAAPTATATVTPTETTPADTTTDGTTSDGTATATPTATPTPTPTTTDEGPGPVFENYEQRLREQGGYAVDWEITIEGSDDTITQTGTTRVDTETGERFDTWELEADAGGRSLTYQLYRAPDSDTVHVCIMTSGRCVRRQTTTGDEGSFGFNNFSSPTGPTNLTATPNVRDEGVVQTDQGPRRKYVADLDSIPPEAREGSFGEYRSLQYEVFVDPDTGLVTRISYSATIERDGQTQSISMTIEYDYGDVDVSPPEWYEG